MSAESVINPLNAFDPFDPEVIESPWDFFAALRREAPLYELPNKAYYIISRYDDVQRAAMDTDTFSSNLVAVLLQDSGEAAPQFLNMANDTGGDEEGAQAGDALAIADPPVHTRQRKVSNRAFTPRRVALMEEEITSLVSTLIDQFIDTGFCDWVSALAVPLPMTIIVRMLGLPEADIPQLKLWSDHAVAILSGVNTPDELAEHGLQALNMSEYLTQKVAILRSQPNEGVISDLIRESESEEGSVNSNEIVSIVMQLVTAGNETTTSLIGSALWHMLKTPHLQQQLREQPEAIETFIEEVLRLETPLFGHFRLVKKDTTIDGKPLPAGSRVMLSWASANRDERKFNVPATLDLQREKPRSHVAFGYGIHHCIGAALARLEARIAIEIILARTSDIRLSTDNDFRHVKSLMVRSLETLNIEFDQQ